MAGEGGVWARCVWLCGLLVVCLRLLYVAPAVVCCDVRDLVYYVCCGAHFCVVRQVVKSCHLVERGCVCILSERLWGVGWGSGYLS